MPERRVLPDQRARDRIEAALDRNLLVEAGAGSGKTESLARRMAAGIAAGVYTVDGMAAVTFTRKAAAELRGRFQLALERRLAAATEAAARARLEAALAHLERLFTGTIHAFCAHLLRERPVEAGVAPGFAELDEVEADARQRAAWRRYLDTQRAADAPGLARLVEAGVDPAELDRAFATVCLHGEVAFPAVATPAPDPRAAWRALVAFGQALDAHLPRPLPPDPECRVLRNARELARAMRVADGGGAAGVAELLARWESPAFRVAEWSGTDGKGQARVAASRRLVAAFQAATVGPFLDAWRAHVHALAVELLTAGRDFAAAERQRAVELTYQDLLERAARVLRDDPRVRAALQEKYRWLFVDEFQDTDPLQAEVLLLLAAEPRAGRDWTRVRLRPGALFIVGDPKQSIYRFRRADIDSYQTVRARIEATGGEVLPLTASFRAAPGLCAWANATFGAIFPRRATPEQPAFHGLDPVRPADRRAASVRQLAIPASVERAEVLPWEAAAIAHWIRGEVDAGRRTPGNVMILTHRKKALATYAAALEAADLPAEVSGAAAFQASPAVAALAALLVAVGEPSDPVATVGVLRGPLFGLSDAELYAHRAAGDHFFFVVERPEPAAGPVAEALGVLRVWHQWARDLPVPAAIERILEASGWLALAAAQTRGGAEAGHCLHAVDRVRRLTERGGTLRDAAAALEEELELADIETVPLEPGRRDVVRVMNLHKAKGLEAPVVFLADPLGGLREAAKLRIVREGRQARGYAPIHVPRGEWHEVLVGRPRDWAIHEAAELAYQRAERSRLLYVAATRAADLLVVSRWAKTGRNRPWEALAPHLATAPILPIPAGPDRAPRAWRGPAATARATAEAARAERRTLLASPSWAVQSVTATAHRGAVPGRPVPGDRVREPDTGLAWGTLIHALLEHAMRHPAADRAQLARLAHWLAFGNAELRRVIPEALDTVEGVRESGFWTRALTALDRLPEVPVAVAVPAGEGPPTVLHGVIDLALRFPDGWELIDYKTDQLELADLERQYGEQVRTYAAQWGRLVAAPVTYAGLYAVRAGRLSGNLAKVHG